MAWVASGLVALLLLALLLRWFAAAPIGQLRAALFWAGGLGAATAAVLLALSGRGGQLGWAAVLFGPMLWRWWRGRRLAARFAAPPGDAVRTATLEMRLDPVAGTWTGTVRRGAESGRDLAALSPEALRALLRDCEAADPESVPLLEAWLDRAHPGWRDAASGADAAAPDTAGSMTREDALAVLGLGRDADADAVRAAYTRLMRAAHPDAGGSDWLAARLNAARDALLRG